MTMFNQKLTKESGDVFNCLVHLKYFRFQLWCISELDWLSFSSHFSSPSSEVNILGMFPIKMFKSVCSFQVPVLSSVQFRWPSLESVNPWHLRVLNKQPYYLLFLVAFNYSGGLLMWHTPDVTSGIYCRRNKLFKIAYLSRHSVKAALLLFLKPRLNVLALFRCGGSFVWLFK